VVRSAGVTTVVLGAGVFAYGALTVIVAGRQTSGMHSLWEQATEPAA
jgi:hypothetical protein